MINNPYNLNSDLSWTYKLWDYKESHDLTVIGLANKLKENPKNIEKWLRGDIDKQSTLTIKQKIRKAL